MTGRSRQVSLSLIIFLMCWVSRAGSHHATAGVYDVSQQMTVEGVVTEFRFINPHSMMSMNVTDASGKTKKWTVEFAGRLNLSEVGFTADSFKKREHVTVTGNPGRAVGERMLFVKAVKADGTQLLSSTVQRLNAVEETRRKLREQNANSQK